MRLPHASPACRTSSSYRDHRRPACPQGAADQVDAARGQHSDGRRLVLQRRRRGRRRHLRSRFDPGDADRGAGAAIGAPAVRWLAAREITAPDGRRLDDPVGSSSLVAVLNEVSSELGNGAEPPEPVVVGAGAGRRRADAGRGYRRRPRADAARAPPADLRRHRAGVTRRHRNPARAVDQARPPLARAERRGRRPPARREPRRPRRTSQRPGGDPRPAYAPPHVEVLWRLGLAAGRETLLPPFTADHALGLIRWPDFGRLTHTPAHVKLAARLVRRPYTLEELAEAAQMPVGEVRVSSTGRRSAG